MSRLLAAPPPLAPTNLACGTQLTRRWVRAGFSGYAAGMPGHLVATYYSNEQHCAWTSEGRTLSDRLRPGAVTVIAEGHDGFWTLDGQIEVSHVYLTRQRILDSVARLGSGKRVEILDRVGFEDGVSAGILGVLSDGDLLDEPADHLLVDRCVDLLCLSLLRRHNAFLISPVATRGKLASWQLKRVTDFMLEHLDRRIGLDELAEQARLSRFHFCRAFRITTGRTPHNWLIDQRMARARQLLANPALSISEISLEVGYSTPSAFAASFHRRIGLRPSEYRRARL